MPSDEPHIQIHKVSVHDTGVGREAGFKNDTELVEHARRERQELEALLTPEALAKLDRAEAEAERKFLAGSGASGTGNTMAEEVERLRQLATRVANWDGGHRTAEEMHDVADALKALDQHREEPGLTPEEARALELLARRLLGFTGEPAPHVGATQSALPKLRRLASGGE